MNVRIGYGELSTEQPIHSFTGTSYRYAEYTDSEKEYCKVLQYEIQVLVVPLMHRVYATEKRIPIA